MGINLKKLEKICIIYSIIYWGIYIINVFYTWSLYNPFWWVLEMPYNQGLRSCVLMISSMILTASGALYFIFLNDNGQFEEPK